MVSNLICRDCNCFWQRKATTTRSYENVSLRMNELLMDELNRKGRNRKCSWHQLHLYILDHNSIGSAQDYRLSLAASRGLSNDPNHDGVKSAVQPQIASGWYLADP